MVTSKDLRYILDMCRIVVDGEEIEPRVTVVKIGIRVGYSFSASHEVAVCVPWARLDNLEIEDLIADIRNRVKKKTPQSGAKRAEKIQ